MGLLKSLQMSSLPELQDEGFPVEDIEVMNRKALLWQGDKVAGKVDNERDERQLVSTVL